MENKLVEKLKQDMSDFSIQKIAKESGVSHNVLYPFSQGKRTLSLDNYTKVREAVDKIIEKLNGGKNV
jgi:uncharacterized protein YaaN involved in tellurite resistance